MQWIHSHKGKCSFRILSSRLGGAPCCIEGAVSSHTGRAGSGIGGKAEAERNLLARYSTVVCCTF